MTNSSPFAPLGVTLRVSDDSVKQDLEVICDACGVHLCDAEHGDTLETLAEVAREHAADAHGAAIATGETVAPFAPCDDVTPDVSTFRGVDGAWVVQIDTAESTGRVRVNVNDAAVWDQDPETGEAFPLSGELAETVEPFAPGDLPAALAYLAEQMAGFAEGAEHLQCTEAEAIAAVLTASGYAEIAAVLIAAHAYGDDDAEDLHHEQYLATAGE